MPDPISRFEALAARARHEQAPAVDVRAAVTAQIRAQAWTEFSDDRPAICFAVLTCVAAAAVLVVTAPAISAALDPLSGLFGLGPVLLQ